MNRSIPFSRNLNLLEEADLAIFSQELTSAGYGLPVTSQDEIKELIHFGREFFPDSAFSIAAIVPSIDVAVTFRTGAKRTYSFTSDLLPAMCLLYSSRDDNNFVSRVRTKLTNSSQFDDTVFELKCLNYFKSNGFSFQYEPDIHNIGGPKNPDFRLSRGELELFCECKQIRIGEGKSELQFRGQCAYLLKKLGKDFELQLFDRNLRLEVNFNRSPSTTALDELIEQVKRFAGNDKGIGELPLRVGRDGIEYLVLSQSKPSQFPARTMVTGSMRSTAGKPRRLANPVTRSPEGEVAIFSRDLAERQAQTLRKAIRQAKNQLPDDEVGLVLINRAKSLIAQQEIEKRMNGTQYDNIIGFVVNPFNDFWTCYRTQYSGLLFDLFEGFQLRNPFVKA